MLTDQDAINFQEIGRHSRKKDSTSGEKYYTQNPEEHSYNEVCFAYNLHAIVFRSLINEREDKIVPKEVMLEEIKKACKTLDYIFSEMDKNIKTNKETEFNFLSLEKEMPYKDEIIRCFLTKYNRLEAFLDFYQKNHRQKDEKILLNYKLGKAISIVIYNEENPQFLDFETRNFEKMQKNRSRILQNLNVYYNEKPHFIVYKPLHFFNEDDAKKFIELECEYSIQETKNGVKIYENLTNDEILKNDKRYDEIILSNIFLGAIKQGLEEIGLSVYPKLLLKEAQKSGIKALNSACNNIVIGYDKTPIDKVKYMVKMQDELKKHPSVVKNILNPKLKHYNILLDGDEKKGEIKPTRLMGPMQRPGTLGITEPETEQEQSFWWIVLIFLYKQNF